MKSPLSPPGRRTLSSHVSPVNLCLISRSLSNCPARFAEHGAHQPLQCPAWGRKQHPQATHNLSWAVIWKATKEYLNQRGTKIRVFRACFWAPFLPPFFPLFPPLSPSGPVHSPTTSPLLYPPFSTPGKLRFRYPSDLGTL